MQGYNQQEPAELSVTSSDILPQACPSAGINATAASKNGKLNMQVFFGIAAKIHNELPQISREPGEVVIQCRVTEHLSGGSLPTVEFVGSFLQASGAVPQVHIKLVIGEHLAQRTFPGM